MCGRDVMYSVFPTILILTTVYGLLVGPLTPLKEFFLQLDKGKVK